MSSSGLPLAASELLTAALETYRDDPVGTDWLHDEIDRFEGPLRIAVTGPSRSGKSTLVNAIVGEEIAPVGSGGTFTWYQDGRVPRAVRYRPDGSARELPVSRVDGGLRVDAPPAPDDDDEIVVDWPSRVLRPAVLIDTPAADPGGTTMDRVRTEADAILYATPNLTDRDLRALWPDAMNEVAGSPPVETIVVLSRADEVAGGRIDALTAAKLTARRHDRGVAVRGLCQTVIAVSGLIGYAGRRLSEAEYRALATLADQERPNLDEHLLSVDRFTGARFPVPLEQQTRTDLLDRFGLFGVRLATTLIRTGSASRPALSGQLVQRSGLTGLREAVSELFLNRRPELKARSALLALRSVLRTRPHPDAGRLTAAIEHALASGHELRELGLLAALRYGRTTLPADRAEEARRLVGGYGTDIGARLGVAHDVDDATAWALTEKALIRWREESENPAFDQDQRRAAQTVVRSCEGLLTDLAEKQDR